MNQTYLARDNRGSIMQIGSYDTTDAIVLDGTSASDITALYPYDQSIRLIGFSGDNWITRATLRTDKIDTLIVTGGGLADTNASYTYSGSTWLSPLDEYQIYYNTTDRLWAIELYDDPYTVCYTNPAINATNPPKTGWVVADGGTAPAPTLRYSGYYELSASSEAGMYLPEGAEISMLVYEGDAIATYGGKLNIVEIAR